MILERQLMLGTGAKTCQADFGAVRHAWVYGMPRLRMGFSLTKSDRCTLLSFAIGNRSQPLQLSAAEATGVPRGAHTRDDIISPNFGIQEYSSFNDHTREIFSGCPDIKDGYLPVNEGPGWGIEVNEAAALKYPFSDTKDSLNGGWGEVRKLDGTVIKQ
jgi:hypothetical protein